MADMASKGRADNRAAREASKHHRPRGTDHHATKCTPELVMAIRADRAAGMVYLALSKKYGVPLGTITDIALGNTWTHLPGAVAKKFNRRKTA